MLISLRNKQNVYSMQHVSSKTLISGQNRLKCWFHVNPWQQGGWFHLHVETSRGDCSPQLQNVNFMLTRDGKLESTTSYLYSKNYHASMLTETRIKANVPMRELKVARSDFWVTIPFNFERLEHHHYQSNRKSDVNGVLEKDESFKWGTFHQDLSYHSNEMTPRPILHMTE